MTNDEFTTSLPNIDVVAPRLLVIGARIPKTEVWGYNLPSLRD